MLLCCAGCSRKSLKTIKINDNTYVDVTSFDVKGNGKQDDRVNIQKAINSNQNLFFPKGIYLLESYSEYGGCLLIRKGIDLYFEKGAILKISKNFKQGKNPKPAVIFIEAKLNSVDKVIIEGLTIDGNNENHNMVTSGIVAYEYPSFNIKNLILSNVTIRNVDWCGICTYALNNNFYNISTSKCGSHGIAVNNTRNPFQKHYFYLDRYFSENDKAYSIDFGGKSEDFPFEGVVENVHSKNSKLGIKTAGCWDLELINVIVENPEFNGFYTNRPAPNNYLKLKNFKVINAKRNGFALSKAYNIEMDSCSAINCKMGLAIIDAIVKVNGLYIQGKKIGESYGIRVKSKKVEMFNFELSQIGKNETYAFWVDVEDGYFKNGKIHNNESPYGMIIKGKGNIKLEEVVFGDTNNRSSNKSEFGIYNDLNDGSIHLKDCQFNNILSTNKFKSKVKRVKIIEQ
ncbi:MAG: hypothetical protein ACJATI_003688 [Halioglobus sp.]|jgi:hypothetical protein